MQICQALFPLLIAGLSDERGRRPVLVISLIVCVAINIGLARQTNFAGLMVLRCLQSCGASAVSVVAVATVNDIIRPRDRKEYRVFTSVAYSIAPITCPIVGGLLAQYFGWPGIFYFQGVLAALILVAVVFFHRETCRAHVGDGSVPPRAWNRALKDILWPPPITSPNLETRFLPKRRLTPFQTIKLAFKKPAMLLIISQAILFGGSIAIIITIPAVFTKKYHFNLVELGATHLAYAAGGFTSKWTFTLLSSANIRRHKQLIGGNEESEQYSNMPNDRPRLQVIIPLLYLGCAFVVVYGWILHRDVHFSGPIILLFFIGNALSSAIALLTGLMLELYPQQPASALAAMNSFRFLCAAGAAAAVSPVIKAVGTGWMGTIIALAYVGASSLLWIMYVYAPK
jgi:MFS family permease